MKKLNCILLVDDDDVTNYINQKLLKKLALSEEVKVAKNGEEGLAFVKKYCKKNNECPELILLDINMPVMDGYEFLLNFKQMEFDNLDSIKVVVLTTSTNPKDVNNFADLRISSFVNKPLTKEKMEALLSN